MIIFRSIPLSERTTFKPWYHGFQFKQQPILVLEEVQRLLQFLRVCPIYLNRCLHIPELPPPLSSLPVAIAHSANISIQMFPGSKTSTSPGLARSESTVLSDDQLLGTEMALKQNIVRSKGQAQNGRDGRQEQ